MKQVLFLAMLIFSFQQTYSQTTGIPAAETGKHLNEKATVCDKV
jgi:hypothetical protein